MAATYADTAQQTGVAQQRLSSPGLVQKASWILRFDLYLHSPKFRYVFVSTDLRVGNLRLQVSLYLSYCKTPAVSSIHQGVL